MPRESLEYYSLLMPMVEANTTFYGIPQAETVERWRQQTPETFRFCLKFPRAISHDKCLVDCEAETGEWLRRLRELGRRAGPSFLQLPPDFTPAQMPDLARYLENLPRDLAFSVEPRHSAWFQKPVEDELNALLRELGIGRVLYDVRPLRAGDPSDEDVQRAQAAKPRVPARVAVTANHTHVRYIAYPVWEENGPWLEQWAGKVSQWVAEGRDVYFCMHSIFDAHMPELCRMFHEMVAALTPLPPLPDWSEVGGGQMSLF